MRSKNEGLLFIIDTDYSEPAKDVIDKYVKSHDGTKVMIWNGRHLSTILERHPNLQAKYDLTERKANDYETFSSLKTFRNKKVLIISDQSNLAHNVTAIFKFYNFDITFLPIWNYSNPKRMKVFSDSALKKEFDLIICFLGDTYQYLLPKEICDLLLNRSKAGASILFFPFLAYCIDKGHYEKIEDLVPVLIHSPKSEEIKNIASDFRFGDFSFLFRTDLFAEDDYTEVYLNKEYSHILPNYKSSIPIKHTFEFLKPKDNSEVVLRDWADNPFLVISKNSEFKVAYMNTCTHSCLTTLPVSSPIEANQAMAIVFSDVLTWLLST